MNKILSLSVSLLESVSCISYFNNIRKSSSLFCKMGSVCGKNFANMNTGTMDSTDFVEDVVCQDSDIKENEMKIFDLKDEGKVLLVRQNGKLSALGTKCTHLGAPLDKAALGEGRIRCQWHGACFNIMTGDIEDFPGLDSLPCYQVNVQNNNVVVKAKKSDLTSNKRIKLMASQRCNDDQKIVIIGGGPSGATCAEKLRQEGFTGSITLINKENALPYDRTKVTKVLDFDIKKFQLRMEEFYKEHNINICVNMEATQVNTCQKNVCLSNGESINYDRLYIATGSKPRKLQIPGSNLENVFTVREYVDINKLNSLLHNDKEIVILGVSFIGMELAAVCVDKAKSITVIGRDSAPFKLQFGEQIGARFQKLFEEKGIKFIMNNGVKECIGDNSKLTNVLLNDGTSIKADILVMGVGSTFYTDFLKNSGIEMNPDGSITVNEYMETNVKCVYAGGDIAKAPVFVSDNEKYTIGHYGLAHFHGKVAALNMIGKTTPLKSVPFFWTQLFGKSVRYAGHGNFDDVKIYGDLNELKFLAYYFKNDKVIAMAACQRDPVVSKFAELLNEGKRIYRKDVEEEKLEWSNN